MSFSQQIKSAAVCCPSMAFRVSICEYLQIQKHTNTNTNGKGALFYPFSTIFTHFAPIFPHIFHSFQRGFCYANAARHEKWVVCVHTGGGCKWGECAGELIELLSEETGAGAGADFKLSDVTGCLFNFLSKWEISWQIAVLPVSPLFSGNFLMNLPFS